MMCIVCKGGNEGMVGDDEECETKMYRRRESRRAGAEGWTSCENSNRRRLPWQKVQDAGVQCEMSGLWVGQGPGALGGHTGASE